MIEEKLADGFRERRSCEITQVILLPPSVYVRHDATRVFHHASSRRHDGAFRADALDARHADGALQAPWSIGAQ